MVEKKGPGIKSAYELAMERLAGREGPLAALTDAQKKEIAEIDRQARAKVAEVEILMGKRVAEAREKGDAEELAKLQEQKRVEIERIRSRAESDKDRVRKGGG